MDCPRCAVPIQATPATTESATVTVDTCARCGGIWIDETEIAKVAPELSSIAGAAEALLRSGATPGSSKTGIIACPRCLVAPLEIAFFGVPVDFCPECRGVWLDGDEHTAFDREQDRAGGLPAPGAPSTTYRTAAKIAKEGIVACALCKAETKLERSYMSAAGAICAACHAQLSIAQRQREIDEQVTIENPMRAVMSPNGPRETSSFDKTFSAEQTGPYVRGFFAILDALAATNRRPR